MGVAALVALSALSALSAPVRASEPAAPVRWSAFVDTYVAWDVHRPVTFDRAYTTQAARHGEFNVNLAFVEARLERERTRGRLALHWGTSVQANTAGEPRVGAVSGPDVSRFVQEASVGWRLAPPVWLDAGVFLSHVGQEGWISRDNLAYTRSLIAEFTPYSESGVRLTWAATPAVTLTGVLVNGWQNVSAENASPGAGMRADWAASPSLTLSYDNLVADVAPDTARSRVRVWHDVIAVFRPSAAWTVAAVGSFGTETRGGVGAPSTISGGTLTARWQARPTLALVGRVEALDDPDARLVGTPAGAPFRTMGASLGVDARPDADVLWRTEVRAFSSRAGVWPARDGSLAARAGVLVTSLSLSF